MSQEALVAAQGFNGIVAGGYEQGAQASVHLCRAIFPGQQHLPQIRHSSSSDEVLSFAQGHRFCPRLRPARPAITHLQVLLTFGANKNDLAPFCQVAEASLHNTGATGVAPACDITT